MKRVLGLLLAVATVLALAGVAAASPNGTVGLDSARVGESR